MTATQARRQGLEGTSGFTGVVLSVVEYPDGHVSAALSGTRGQNEKVLIRMQELDSTEEARRWASSAAEAIGLRDLKVEHRRAEERTGAAKYPERG